MALCRSCQQSEGAETVGDEDRFERTDRPPSEGEGAAVLLLRVWAEDRDLRCRLMFVKDPSSQPSVAVAQGVDAICEAVRGWLLQVTGAEGPVGVTP